MYQSLFQTYKEQLPGIKWGNKGDFTRRALDQINLVISDAA
jgi:hypothetical protein